MQTLGITWKSISTSASTSVVRARAFSAGHRYWNPKLSEVENQKVYGKLYRKEGFGHNFRVEATFEGKPERESGMILNLSEIDRVMNEVLSQLDHFYLNDLELFEPVTLEKITAWIGDSLAKGVKGSARVSRVRVYEGDQTWVDYIP